MTTLARTCLAICACLYLGESATGADPVESVDDRSLKKKFESIVGEWLDAEGDNQALPTPEEIRGQLGGQSTCALDLPVDRACVVSKRTPAEIYAEGRENTLMVGHVYKCSQCDAWHSSLACGFVITEDGVAVTAHHVLEAKDAAAFAAMTVDGRVFPVRQVLAVSKANDIALVRLDTGDHRFRSPFVLGEGQPVGSAVSVISHPEGRFYTFSRGILSRYYFQWKGRGGKRPRMAVTADFARGSSGGPVIDDHGRVTGMVSATRSVYYNREDGHDQNLQMVVKECIPAHCILDLIEAPQPEPETAEAPGDKPAPVETEPVEASDDR